MDLTLRYSNKYLLYRREFVSLCCCTPTTFHIPLQLEIVHQLRGRSRRASTALRLLRLPGSGDASGRWIWRYQHTDEELLHFEGGSLYGLKNALSRDVSRSTSRSSPPRSRASWLSPPPSPGYGFDVTFYGFDVTLYGFDVTLYGFDVTLQRFFNACKYLYINTIRGLFEEVLHHYRII